MVLKINRRSERPNLKKVLVYGFDGTGKSTFAYNYCKQNGLNPVVIDIDDTNYTDLPLIEFNRTNDTVLYENLKRIIKELKEEVEFDTIILDGVSSLLELLISNGRGMSKYGDRTSRWNKLLNLLLDSNKNLIFIGQIDMLVIEGESSKAVINVNSIINEKYRCIYENGKYLYETEKYRVLSEDKIEKVNETFETADKVNREEDLIHKKAQEIITNVKRKPIYKEVNFFNAKLELARLMKEDNFTKNNSEDIVKCLEVLLNGQ